MAIRLEAVTVSGGETTVATKQSYRANIPAWAMARADIMLSAAIVLALALKFLLAFRINIHWDEFNFLSQVHDYLRGDLVARFQTFHVHFFSWLPILGAGEIDQIVAGRLAIGICVTGSALLIYGIARRFASHSGALFAVLAYLSVSVVVDHGASFRTDPIATFLALLSFYLLLRRPGEPVGAALAGAVMAIAMLVTIKSVFHLAVIGAAIWWLAPGWRARARLAMPFAVTFALLFCAGYLWHASVLAAPEASAAAGSLGRTASKMFLEDGLIPRWRELLIVVALNPLFWFMTVLGAVTAWGWTRGRNGRNAGEGWLVLALALPLLTPLFYRNAFAYFYVFILPAASLLVGIAYDGYLRRSVTEIEAKRLPFVLLLLLAQCALFLANYALRMPDRIEPQRKTLAAIHAVFPEPVPYIGGYGIAATMPRVGFFMSGWGMDNYRRAGRPIFADLVAKAQPPLLLADSAALSAALLPGWEVAERYTLLPADIRYLKDNYLPYWGIIFIAGKQIELPSSGEKASFEIAIGGEYRLESNAPVLIDGIKRKPGDVVTLAIGTHRVDVDPGTDHVSFRWAAALPPPASEPTDIWTFFAAQ
jgi:hypothetical protein